ncbi:nuclear receptor coactivator 5 isoform X6 [Echinops telfairi]|uniref:Nuclear receptor coactivator 5 isoform X6 n=1 Tax=Echinops telfairi TaxID=9371 RepID=A0AC55DHK7_ECHTE|nr:nuclear receptor coactivator 5 isoform X6 [Echinops telfairi]
MLSGEGCLVGGNFLLQSGEWSALPFVCLSLLLLLPTGIHMALETVVIRDMIQDTIAPQFGEVQGGSPGMAGMLGITETRGTTEITETCGTRDMRDPREPVYRREGSYDRYMRLDDFGRRKDDSYSDPYRDNFDGRGPPGPDSQSRAKERLKREERRREELYHQYFDEIQRRFDAERPVDCSVIVVNKQTKDYAESVGRKVRDLGMVVDLIFLNTEVSLSQALEDVSRGGSPFAIVITQQHQIHRSCTVNIMFGTPQEHRNMPQADAMVLVARNYERYKNECREKEREEVVRQATKMADEALIQERERGGPDEGLRGGHPPAMQSLINLLADNRYLTAEETDKIINYLRERKERLIRSSTNSLPGELRGRAEARFPASLLGQPRVPH